MYIYKYIYNSERKSRGCGAICAQIEPRRSLISQIRCKIHA